MVRGVIKYICGVKVNVKKLTPLPQKKTFGVRKKTLTQRKKGLSVNMLSCDMIWVQRDMANAINDVYIFSNDVLHFFWANCLLIS